MGSNGKDNSGNGCGASRRQFITALACLGGALLLPGGALAGTERPLCPVCRRYLDTSPQACNAFILLGGRHEKSINACSMLCLHEQLAKYESEPEHILINDYNTVGTDFVLQLNVIQAYFVFDAKGDDDLSNAPFVYAFRKEEDARALMKERGGELMEWDELAPRCVELAEEWEREKPQYRHSPNLRGRE